eukprot:g2296.t1
MTDETNFSLLKLGYDCIPNDVLLRKQDESAYSLKQVAQYLSDRSTAEANLATKLIACIRSTKTHNPVSSFFSAVTTGSTSGPPKCDFREYGTLEHALRGSQHYTEDVAALAQLHADELNSICKDLTDYMAKDDAVMKRAKTKIKQVKKTFKNNNDTHNYNINNYLEKQRLWVTAKEAMERLSAQISEQQEKQEDCLRSSSGVINDNEKLNGSDLLGVKMATDNTNKQGSRAMLRRARTQSSPAELQVQLDRLEKLKTRVSRASSNLSSATSLVKNSALERSQAMDNCMHRYQEFATELENREANRCHLLKRALKTMVQSERAMLEKRIRLLTTLEENFISDINSETDVRKFANLEWINATLTQREGWEMRDVHLKERNYRRKSAESNWQRKDSRADTTTAASSSRSSSGTLSTPIVSSLSREPATTEVINGTLHEVDHHHKNSTTIDNGFRISENDKVVLDKFIEECFEAEIDTDGEEMELKRRMSGSMHTDSPLKKNHDFMIGSTKPSIASRIPIRSNEGKYLNELEVSDHLQRVVNLMTKQNRRSYFIRALNQQRSKSQLIRSRRSFIRLAYSMYTFLDCARNDNDVGNMKKLMIMSETFYRLKEEEEEDSNDTVAVVPATVVVRKEEKKGEQDIIGSVTPLATTKENEPATSPNNALSSSKRPISTPSNNASNSSPQSRTATKMIRKENRKEYLQALIMHHQVWHDLSFWEEAFYMSVREEVLKVVRQRSEMNISDSTFFLHHHSDTLLDASSSSSNSERSPSFNSTGYRSPQKKKEITSSGRAEHQHEHQYDEGADGRETVRRNESTSGRRDTEEWTKVRSPSVSTLVRRTADLDNMLSGTSLTKGSASLVSSSLSSSSPASLQDSVTSNASSTAESVTSASDGGFSSGSRSSSSLVSESCLAEARLSFHNYPEYTNEELKILHEDASMLNAFYFGNLGSFANAMKSFRIKEEITRQFVRRIGQVNGLSSDQIKMVLTNLSLKK